MKAHMTLIARPNFFKAILLVLTLVYFSNSNADQESQSVLITGNSSVITKLEKKDIRRIFLGLRPINKTFAQKPIINLSNQATYKLFLKNIMFLTERGYKRKLLKRMFRQGADKVDSIETKKELIKYLNDNPDNISFMLKSDAVDNKNIKIIQALW